MTDIKRRALAKRAELGLELDTLTPAENVLQACQAATGIEREFLEPDDVLLAGARAVLNLPYERIFQDGSLELAEQRFDAAHEFAHVWLHSETCHCSPGDLTPDRTAEVPGSPQSVVDGYSPRQKREGEANAFAAELLLPGPVARRLFLDEGKNASEIAGLLGLPAFIVQSQLAEAVLLPPLTEASERPAPASAKPVDLDASQQAAAHAASGPLLLGAGPGTGKTKTLVERCRSLVQEQGVPAEKILALTFSRKAAGEMRERLALAGVGTKTVGPWVGTFHAFGLETLRRFGDRLGLSGDPKLLDGLDAVSLLENHLTALNLEALDNLYNPAVHLGPILGQIKRAKDELCSPERYAELCAAMTVRADAEAAALKARGGKVLKKEQEAVDKALLQATKATEVARCYPIYERLKRENGFLDYADLITQTVALLETHADVRAILQAEYPHVLADEYQDVNRASARLVRLLAGGEALGLWAVGDSRQSIYQFQGASPANVAAFARDYPNGQRLDLGVNYRSRSAIVSLFGEAARQMDGPNLFETAGWHAHRGVDDAAPFPAVSLAVAPDAEGQADGIAQTARVLEAGGQPLKQQAILCRTHGQAQGLSEALAARGVPTLYLGPLLERPEIKDLLCLLALLAESGGTALVRVGAWPEYAVPQSDTLALLAQISREETSLLEALQEESLHPGLRMLGEHLAELETMDSDPAALLHYYLFGQSRYLRELLDRAPDPFTRMASGLAIHQLLGLATGAAQRVVVPKAHTGPPHPVREFLAYLRRRTASGETLRVGLPEEADDWDAVRLLTAHAAKGLEYPVVFLPHLSVGHFPTRGRSDGLVAPPGLIDTGDADAETDEEMCLFFVALSRAREHLVLCRAETYGAGRAAAPTALLSLIQPGLDALGIAEDAWPSGKSPAEAAAPDALGPPPTTLPEYSSSALEAYGRCPRLYHYQYALHLPGGFTASGYPQFHACVRRVLHWLEDARAQNQSPTESEILARLDGFWEESGPVGHLHEDKYKGSAQMMLREAALMGSPTETRTDSRTLRATLTHCHVFVRPDALRRDSADGTLIAARHLTGRIGGDDHTDKRLALYRRAATQTHPDAPLRIELRYLARGECKVVMPPTTNLQVKWEADRVEKYDAAAQGVAQGRFPAAPASADECGKCPYALICPL